MYSRFQSIKIYKSKCAIDIRMDSNGSEVNTGNIKHASNPTWDFLGENCENYERRRDVILDFTYTYIPHPWSLFSLSWGWLSVDCFIVCRQQLWTVVAQWLGNFVQTVIKKQLNYEKFHFSEQHFTITSDNEITCVIVIFPSKHPYALPTAH